MLLLCVCVLFLSILLQCDNPYDTRWRPERLLLYDKHPGGIGLVAQVGRRPGGAQLGRGGQKKKKTKLGPQGRTVICEDKGGVVLCKG